MEDEDPFGMGPPPALSEPSAEPVAGNGDDFGSNMFDAPPSQDALPSFGDDSAAMPPMGGDDFGSMGGMGDMGGAMPAAPMGGGLGGMDADAFMAPPGGEMGPVAKWRIEQQEKVSAKATAAAAAESAKIAEAQTALQQFYAERSEKIAKRAAENRAAEAQYVQDRDAAMIADSWESVGKLVDLKEKAGATVDTSRMRSLLIQLKN